MTGEGGGADKCAPPSLDQGGVGEGGSMFCDKAKNIRDKMRYSNLSNNRC